MMSLFLYLKCLKLFLEVLIDAMIKPFSYDNVVFNKYKLKHMLSFAELKSPCHCFRFFWRAKIKYPDLTSEVITYSSILACQPMLPISKYRISHQSILRFSRDNGCKTLH